MAGNSQRQGAKRAPGSKKGATVGSGGQKSKGLRGRGPTPKATERTKHVAAKRSATAARRGGPAPTQGGRSGGGRPGAGRPGGRPAAREGNEVVAGRNSVVEALRAHIPATALHVADRIDADERVKEAIALANAARLPILEVPRGELDRLAAGAVHQGLALTVPPYHYAHPDDLPRLAHETGTPPLIVALDGVTDPRNLGAVVRSAAAFGAHGVVVPERRAAGMTASAWKSSAGAAARIPVARATNLTRQLEKYREAGMVVVGLDADGSVDAADLEVATDPLVVVVGAEGAGLSRLVVRACDLLVRIPMARGNESLNAGVAAGIVLYEVARHRS
jgi:23S rRNA (guanosine2251-2'-O)-methyltransferase